jgi:mRNA interferase RelE/StbE
VEYSVELSPAAERDLDRLPKAVQDRLLPRLLALGTDPRPNGCKKLSPPLEGYRIRVGDYRIVYSVHADAAIVLIAKIAKRDKVYR